MLYELLHAEMIILIIFEKKDTDFFNLPYIIITTTNSLKIFIEFNLIYNLSNSIRKLVFS